MATRTQIKLTLTGVHMCCQGCTDAIDASLMNVFGVNSHCDMENQAVTFTASDAVGAREALQSLADEGFYGESDDPTLTIQTGSDIPPGIVNRAGVSGIHNCCDLCCDAIKQAISTVDGVTGDTARPKVTSFDVTGAFRPVELLRALNGAGFNAKIRA